MTRIMKLLIISVICLNIVLATTYNTPIIDGTITEVAADWDADENMGSRDPNGPLEFFHYITWDANYLYIGYVDLDWADNSNDNIVAHFDFLSGGSTEGVRTEALGMTADFAFVFDRQGPNGVVTFFTTRTQGQGTWSGTVQTWVESPATADIVFNATTHHTEMRILWSVLTQGEATGPTPFVYYTAVEDNAGNEDWIWPNPSPACPGSFETLLFEAGPNFEGVEPNAGPPNGIEVVCNPADQALPVELSSFTVESTGQGVLCKWTTESELENLGFLLERKTEGTDWKEIVSYKTDNSLFGQGTTSSYTDYKYLDVFVEPNTTFEYRLADVDYNGVITYHSVRTITVEQAPLTSMVEEFTVLPAYPNPFNPVTTITYGLNNDSKVNITIYDITGQLITTLLNTEQTQGWHSVSWNGTNQQGTQVPAGLYLSRILSGKEVKTSKLMLLK